MMEDYGMGKYNWDKIKEINKMIAFVLNDHDVSIKGVEYIPAQFTNRLYLSDVTYGLDSFLLIDDLDFRDKDYEKDPDLYIMIRVIDKIIESRLAFYRKDDDG